MLKNILVQVFLKMKDVKVMKKEYIFDTFDYGKVTIVLNNDSLTISRSGLMAKLKYGHAGKKTFMINQISAVEIKDAGITMGHIQFIFAGTIAKKQPLFASQKDRADENTVMFSKKEKNIEAQEIKEYIEKYNSNQTNNIAEDKYDKLEKLQKLLDNGTINQDEFEEEKRKILNQ